MHLLDHLKILIRNSTAWNPMYETAPTCILWPDKEKQWQGVIDILQKEIPELFILGNYKPEERTGPAIWLRCVLANTIDGITIPPGSIPIIYLSGFSRIELKPVDKCRDEIKIIAPYQYSGVIWSQMNSPKDWTIIDILSSAQGGLNLDVVENEETKDALMVCLRTLLYTPIESLKGKQLNAGYFYSLLSGDTDKSFLEWINKGDSFKKAINENEWKAITEKVKERYDFNMEQDGLLTAVENFANRKDRWEQLWKRFCESPKRYPNIPTQIRRCQLPASPPSGFQIESVLDGWPQWNEKQENILRDKMSSLEGTTAETARRIILELEQEHKRRRSLVWTELGESPLALSLEHLAHIAELSQKGLNSGTIADIASDYAKYGYTIDDAVLKSLDPLERREDRNAVIIVLYAIYKPWLEESALHFQNLVQKDNSANGALKHHLSYDYHNGDCILFVDGLRYDIAVRLTNILEASGFAHTEEPVWAALPTITATGKPVTVPLAKNINGKEINKEFIPTIVEFDEKADSVHLRRLLSDNGWIFLDKASNGDGSGFAWCEEGNIDRDGHTRGIKFSKGIQNILLEIKERIAALFKSGWRRVFIVSDHGWLFLPGGLPLDTKLSTDLTEAKWGRCALSKEGSLIDHNQYPWYWNQSRFFIAANGISCFYNGYEYAHGGVSLEECLLLRICVSPGVLTANQVRITQTKWIGMGCQITIASAIEGLEADIRTQPESKVSSIANKRKEFKDNMTVRINVSDDDMEGKEAFIVILDRHGTVLTQQKTVIGGQPGLLW